MPKFATDGENLFAQISFQVKYYKDICRRRQDIESTLPSMMSQQSCAALCFRTSSNGYTFPAAITARLPCFQDSTN
jgi:hypothetical protein